MNEHLGGYFYIPRNQTNQTLAEVAATIFQHLGGGERHVVFYEPGEKAQAIPVEEVWKKQQQVGIGKGMIEIGVGTELVTDVSIRFELDQEGYHLVQIFIRSAQISYLDDPALVANIDLFVQRWLACCEALHADYAYFSKSEVLLEPRCRDAYLVALRAGNLEKLLEDLIIDWLVYLGPTFERQAILEAFRWAQQKQYQLLQYVKPQVSDSGAIFLRMSQDASHLPYEEPVEEANDRG